MDADVLAFLSVWFFGQHDEVFLRMLERKLGFRSKKGSPTSDALFYASVFQPRLDLSWNKRNAQT